MLHKMPCRNFGKIFVTPGQKEVTSEKNNFHDMSVRNVNKSYSRTVVVVVYVVTNGLDPNRTVGLVGDRMKGSGLLGLEVLCFFENMLKLMLIINYTSFAIPYHLCGIALAFIIGSLTTRTHDTPVYNYAG